MTKEEINLIAAAIAKVAARETTIKNSDYRLGIRVGIELCAFELVEKLFSDSFHNESKQKQFLKDCGLIS